MCEEVHRPLAYMSAVLFVASSTQITGQGTEIEARKERVLVKNTGFNILWSFGPVGHLPSFIVASGYFFCLFKGPWGKREQNGLEYVDGIQAFALWSWGHRLRRETGGWVQVR